MSAEVEIVWAMPGGLDGFRNNQMTGTHTILPTQDMLPQMQQSDSVTNITANNYERYGDKSLSSLSKVYPMQHRNEANNLMQSTMQVDDQFKSDNALPFGQKTFVVENAGLPRYEDNQNIQSNLQYLQYEQSKYSESN
jgi:hypothetical protein